MEHTHLLGTHGHWFWIIPILFIAVMFVSGSFMRRRMISWRWSPARIGARRFDCCGPGRGSRSDWWPETPGQILDRRYASGEITKEQRARMKHELKLSSSRTGMEAK